MLRTSALRHSPHRESVAALLAALPDHAALLEGTDLSAIDDFDAILIATRNPFDVTATFLAARPVAAERIQSRLEARQLPPPDPRHIRFFDGVAVLASPADLQALEPSPSTTAQADVDGGSAPRDWLKTLQTIDTNGAAFDVVLPDVRWLLRFGDGLPTPASLTLATTATASPAIRARATFDTPDEARRMSSAWPAIVERWRRQTSLFGLGRALDDLRMEAKGNLVELVGTLPAAELTLGLALARSFLPPPRSAVDGGAGSR